MMPTPSRDFWLIHRQSLFMQIGAIEKLLKISPTTKQMRDWARAKYGDCGTIKADDVKVKIAELETN